MGQRIEKQNVCPVCGSTGGTLICPDCGFDHSKHYEMYPTLVPIPRGQKAVSKLQAEREEARKPKPTPKPPVKKEEPKPALKPPVKKEEPKPAPKPPVKKEEPKPTPKPEVKKAKSGIWTAVAVIALICGVIGFVVSQENTPKKVSFPSVNKQNTTSTSNNSTTTTTVEYTNGDVYEGQIQNDQCNGYGIMYYANGDVYEGQWKNDYPHGEGVATLVNGEVYEGELKNGYFHGQGVHYSVTDGWYYEGQFQDGERHGQGLFMYASGNIYSGNWVYGCPSGTGDFYWADSETLYTGTVETDAGGRFIGGTGTYYDENDNPHDAYWENDTMYWE